MAASGHIRNFLRISYCNIMCHRVGTGGTGDGLPPNVKMSMLSAHLQLTGLPFLHVRVSPVWNVA